MKNRDGMLMREFESLYDILHSGGYYRELLANANIVKEALKASTKAFIDKLDRL